jgi:hypothetical protein
MALAATGQAQPAGAGSLATQADELFERGKVAFEQGDFALAAHAYQKAWELAQSYDIAANLGQAELELGWFREAAEHLTFALRNLPLSVAAETREQIRDMLARAKQEVASLNLHVEPAGAEVTVDGRTVGTAPLGAELFVEPGTHTVQVRLEGHEPAHQQVLMLVLEPLPEQAAAPAAGEPIPSPPRAEAIQPDASGPSLIPVVVAAGVGIAGLATGVGCELGAAAKRSDRDERLSRLGAESACAAGTPFDSECAAIDDLDSEATTLHTVAVVGFATAGVATAAMLTYLLWPRPATEQGLSVAPMTAARGGMVSLRGVF